MNCKLRFARPSPNPRKIQPAGTSSTQHISTFSFLCSRWATIKTPPKRWTALMVAVPANSAVRRWAPRSSRRSASCPRLENALHGLNAVPRSQQPRPRHPAQRTPLLWICHSPSPLSEKERTLQPLMSSYPRQIHSHVIDNSRFNASPSWWEVRPVLIMNQSD